MLEGVLVEIMGELERREGDGWTRSATLTETVIFLAGVL